MREAGRQLVLDLPVSPRYGAEDFLVGPPNEAARAMMEAWPRWPAPVALLIGPPGSGKSHLAAIWAGRAGAASLPAREVVAGRDLDEMLAGGDALLVEDLHRGPLDEGALFHLLNAVRERGVSLLATSEVPAERLGLATPDLLSRLRLAPAFALGPPDDALLRAVLVKLFADRQVAVDAATVDYVASRIERSLAAAAAAVAALDQEALSRGRRVTRPIAADWLAASGAADRDDEDGVTEAS